MGKRYSREEKDLIKALVEEDMTSQEIASRLGRPEAGVRNLRHRLGLKKKTRDQLQTLKNTERKLTDRVARLNHELQSMEVKRDTISKALQLEETALRSRLERELNRLKHQKPDLFLITSGEFLGKIVTEIIGASLRWLITD